MAMHWIQPKTFLLAVSLGLLVLVLFSLSALELERATFRTCTDPYLASSLALLGSIGLGLFG